MSDEDSSSEDEDYADVVRPFYLVLNWGMTGNQADVIPFCKKLNYAAVYFKPEVQISVAPPSTYVISMRKSLKQRIGVVSQSCCHEESGAFTGEVSASMLRNVKTFGVICGHWEKRRRCGERPGVVALQVQRATENRQIAYLCFGDSMEERVKGKSLEVIASQIKPLFELPLDWRKIVLVYQPVWSFKDEALVATEVEFPEEEETEENANEDEEEEVNVNVNNQLDDEDGVGGRESKIFDDRKWGVVLPPKCVHVDDMLGEVRLWLRNHASKKIAWTTPILYGGHVAAHDGPEFARMKNIDGLFVTRKSLILEDIILSSSSGESEGSATATGGDPLVDADGIDKSELDADVEDFISMVMQCGDNMKDDLNENRTRIQFQVGQSAAPKATSRATTGATSRATTVATTRGWKSRRSNRKR